MKRIIKLTESDFKKIVSKIIIESSPTIEEKVFKWLDELLFDYEFKKTEVGPYGDTENINLTNPHTNLYDISLFADGTYGIRSRFLDELLEYIPIKRSVMYNIIEEWGAKIIENRTESNKVADAIKKRDN